jgi:hypothetical protein
MPPCEVRRQPTRRVQQPIWIDRPGRWGFMIPPGREIPSYDLAACCFARELIGANWKALDV